MLKIDNATGHTYSTALQASEEETLTAGAVNVPYTWVTNTCQSRHSTWEPHSCRSVMSPSRKEKRWSRAVCLEFEFFPTISHQLHKLLTSLCSFPPLKMGKVAAAALKGYCDNDNDNCRKQAKPLSQCPALKQIISS